MLNALEPGTVMPIHRPRASSETVVVIRGKIRWIFYDENGNETERVLLDANGKNRMLVVGKDRWHSLECLESGWYFLNLRTGRMSRWGRRIFLLSDESEMKSEKIMDMMKGVWAFCSFLFWPQRRPKEE